MKLPFSPSRSDETGSMKAAPARTRRDWVALGVLMAAASFVFLWNLDASGYANEFYSAAAQAGSVSWEAFLWGASDSGLAITVDKPPAAIWLMALSVRILGLSSFAILLPQALLGIASTYLLYAIVRRSWGNFAGIVAGAVFITTPVAALMFRFNNPDALLVFLMIATVGCTLRSLEYPASRQGNLKRTLWLVLGGICVGFGFLTKQFQVLLVLPGIAIALFALSPTTLPQRFIDAALALAAVVLSAGWWVLLTVVVPSGSRPYIGGSQTDSFLELTFGYNGLGRLSGNEVGSVVPGAGGTAQGGMWGETGLFRLFGSDFGDQISWLSLIAFAAIVIAVVFILRRKRAGATDRSTRTALASTIVFGVWFALTWLVFSFMAGIFHQYYTVALAPGLAALVAIGAHCLRETIDQAPTRALAFVLIALSSLWGCVLIARSGWNEWLGALVLVAGFASSGVGLCSALYHDGRKNRRDRRRDKTILTAALAIGVVAVMLGPAVWTGCTIASGYHGSIVTAGPTSTMDAPGNQGGPNDDQGDGADEGSTEHGAASGQPGGDDEAHGAGGSQPSGLLGGGSSNDEVAALLKEDADQYRWSAATCGSQSAAGYQLASETPVMAIGGFNGSDPSPTLEEFKEYVEAGLIHYYISSNGTGGSQMGGSNASSEIEQWVEQNFTATTVGGTTIYDLTK